MTFVLATFYKFVKLTNYFDMKGPLKKFCIEHDIKGTIILGEEGINATISSINTENIEYFFDFLNLDTRLTNINYQKHYSDNSPFEKIKVRLKRSIVNIGIDELNCSLQNNSYVSPNNWDELISNQDVLLIDTRNDYEVELGKFKNAINPKTQSFRDLPIWIENYVSKKLHEDTKIAMYCTGGIRCEKSVSLLKSLGFKKTYQLHGGIINYLAQTNNQNFMWQGNCFVFDDRISIDHNLEPNKNIKCLQCKQKVSAEDLKSITKGKIICKNCQSL